MKLLKSIAVALTLFGLPFACCKKDCTDPVPSTAKCNNNPIRFDALAVGQASCYLGLSGENYNSNTADQFVYSDDTLEVSIIAQDGNGFMVAEKFEYVGLVDDWLKPDKDSVYHYYIKVSNDTLRFKPINNTYLFSRIFSYQIVMQGLPLGKYTNQSIEIKGWKTSLPYCECRKEGYIENYDLLGRTYPYLNVLVENTAMTLDGNGETYVFGAGAGLVRASNYSWWSSTGIGWDLLPN